MKATANWPTCSRVIRQLRGEALEHAGVQQEPLQLGGLALERFLFARRIRLLYQMAGIAQKFMEASQALAR